MEQIMNYIKPELLVVAVVLYFVGMWFKNAEFMPDKYIPMVLGLIGIALCALWVLSTSTMSTGQDFAEAIFVAIVQGILVAGLSTYVDQLIKQSHKDE